jgi:hypothetical protein
VELAQGVGPQFKPQYRQKKQKEKKEIRTTVNYQIIGTDWKGHEGTSKGYRYRNVLSLD